MKASKCLIIPIDDMKRLMHFLMPNDRDIYTKMQKANVLKIYNQIQEDIQEE